MCISKFAIEGFTEGLTKEVHPDWGIRFLIVEPGAVKTQFLSNMITTSDHPAYSNPACPTNQLRTFFKAPQTSSSDSIARAILEASQREKIPLRLPLGPDSWSMIMEKVANMRSELQAVESMSLGVQMS